MRKMFSKEQIKKIIEEKTSYPYAILTIQGSDEDNNLFIQAEAFIDVNSIDDDMSFYVLRNSSGCPLDILHINATEEAASFDSGDVVDACSVSIKDLNGQELFIFNC